MYAEERQQAILALARSKGRVDVVALAEEFSVTTETIRRDLTVLERAGTVRRVHGGAMPVERLGFEPELAARDAVMTEEKQRIAKAALEELPAEGSIIVDAGTTTARFVQMLPTDRELTVIVNSPPHASVLAARPNLTVIILGGRVRGRTLATVDDWVLRPLADLWVDVAFMATNGCSVERGLTTSDQAEAAVKRAMIASSRRRVLLADRTKIGNDHLVRFADLSDIDVLITDTGLDTDLAADLAAVGPEIVRA
ncbi:DeoR family transcriptional regulator [Actinomadura hallensis]|uniref:Lactose phosphotransferase system repressor n=1 Tax=Actinomadura hallensis TaxID=337895 RepID=A0A543IEV0_9ACTN|nr:DeoR/GlpR family DNA-binding transcription regulator [Actinomadura hallensis]TQM69040.1 DeoR family transcriptional regulator [Actinomadura hallensis]HLV74669.1 DeoR/GlpR family DNA-binding transcription regulator [Vulgatibacteraceae bacterium]